MWDAYASSVCQFTNPLGGHGRLLVIMWQNEATSCTFIQCKIADQVLLLH